MNILLILTDDQGCWAMGCAGNTEIKTPNLDRLAAVGTRFENFFCVSPVCSPARASLLTGRIPSQHGVHDWLRGGNSSMESKRGQGHLIEYLEGLSGYTDLMAAGGMTCGISGKWHMGDSHHPQKSLSYWEVHATGGGPYYGAPMIKDGEVITEPRYVTHVITDNALAFLEQQKGSETPFYLSVHYTAPHSPWGRAMHPHDTWDDYFDNCPLESAPDLPMHPWQQGTTCPNDPKQRRANLSGYYTAITEMDRHVGRLLDWLEREDLVNDTLVIFTSDNGMNMGHHGLWGKGNASYPMNMYDTSVKVPMIISCPGLVPEGRVCDALLSHYDVRPTLCELLGLEDADADSLPGRSFAGILKGDAGDGREDVIVYDEYGPVRMVRTRTWKYVHRYCCDAFELYDLEADPGETTNLYGQAEHETRVAEMRSRLDEWFAAYVDPAVDGANETVYGKGQLRRAGSRGPGQGAYNDDWQYVDGTQTPRPLTSL